MDCFTVRRENGAHKTAWRWLRRDVADTGQTYRALLDCYRILRNRFTYDKGGKSHHSRVMPTLTLERSKSKRSLTVVKDYDVAANAKKRISLRSAKTKYFHVKALSNGCFLLEPRVLVSPEAISARSLKMLDKSVANLKKGLASAPASPGSGATS